MLSAMRDTIVFNIVFLLFNTGECSALYGNEGKALSEVKVAVDLRLEAT